MVAFCSTFPPERRLLWTKTQLCTVWETTSRWSVEHTLLQTQTCTEFRISPQEARLVASGIINHFEVIILKRKNRDAGWVKSCPLRISLLLFRIAFPWFHVKCEEPAGLTRAEGSVASLIRTHILGIWHGQREYLRRSVKWWDSGGRGALLPLSSCPGTHTLRGRTQQEQFDGFASSRNLLFPPLTCH